MLGEALSLLAAALWAASAILVAETLENIDPLTANCVKTLFSSAAMLSIAFVTGEVWNIPSIDLWGLFFVVIAAIIGFGIGDTVFFKSINLIGVSKSYTIVFMYPLITLGLASILLGEAFLLKYVVGAFIILLGVILVTVSKDERNSEENLKGEIAAFGAAILASMGMILVAQGLRSTSVILANTVRYPILFIFLLSVSQFWKRSRIKKKDVVLLALSGVLGMSIGGIVFLTSIQLIGISRATPLSSSSPLWAAIMSSIFLKEKVTWKLILSSVMVIIGTYFLV